MTKETLDSLSFQAGKNFQSAWYRRELHDSLAQELLGLQMLLKSFESHLKNPKANDIWRKIISQTDRAVNCLDGIVNNCIQEYLVGQTLEEAILRTFENENTDLLLIEGASEIVITPDNYAIQLLRVIQEFVSNSIKHGKASQVKISFENVNESVVVTIIDDGIGFDIKSIVHGNGLDNIAFRLEAIGAKYLYESIPKTGTKLKITLYDLHN